jgi:hypothetical protein
VLVGFVRDGGAQGPGILEAQVTAGDQTATTDVEGFYRIEAVPPGEVAVRAAFAERLPHTQTITVIGGHTHWASFALTLAESHEVDPAEGEEELEGPAEGEVVVADGSDPLGPVGAPGAGGDVQGASLTPSDKSGSVGCAVASPTLFWRPRR